METIVKRTEAHFYFILIRINYVLEGRRP